MKNKLLKILAVLLVVAVLTTTLVACKKPEKPPKKPFAITSETTLEELNTAIIERNNYTLEMVYAEGLIGKKHNIYVTNDAIREEVELLENAALAPKETFVVKKEGDQYYEYIKRAYSTALGVADDSLLIQYPINTKRTVDKEYFDYKLNQINNTYISLLDASWYNGSNSKYELKEEKAKDFAGAIGVTIAEAKKMKISMIENKALFEAGTLTLFGKRVLSFSLKNIGDTAINADDSLAKNTEGLTFSNAYDRYKRGGMKISSAVSSDINRNITTDGLNYYREDINGNDTNKIGYFYEKGNFIGYSSGSDGNESSYISGSDLYDELRVFDINKIYLIESFWEKTDGNNYYTINSATEIQAKLIIAAMFPSYSTSYIKDLYSAYFSNARVNFINETVEVTIPNSNGTSTQTMTFSNIGNAKVAKIDAWKNLVPDANTKPSPEDNPEELGDLTILNYEERLGLSALFGFGDVQLSYDRNNAIIMTSSGAVQEGSVVFIDNKYYHIVPKDNSLVRKEIDQATAFEKIADYVAIVKTTFPTKKYWDLLDNKFAFKMSMKDEFMNNVTPDTIENFDAMTMEFQGNKIELIASLGSDQQVIYANSVGTWVVQIPEEIKVMPIAPSEETPVTNITIDNYYEMLQKSAKFTIDNGLISYDQENILMNDGKGSYVGSLVKIEDDYYVVVTDDQNVHKLQKTPTNIAIAFRENFIEYIRSAIPPKSFLVQESGGYALNMDMKDEFFASSGGGEGLEGLHLNFIGDSIVIRLNYIVGDMSINFDKVGINRVIFPNEVYQFEKIEQVTPGLDLTMENIYQESMKSGIIEKNGIECSYDENNILKYDSIGLAIGSLVNINGKYYEIVSGNNKREITLQDFTNKRTAILESMQIGILQQRYWTNTPNGFYKLDENYRAEVCTYVLNVPNNDQNMILALSSSTFEACFLFNDSIRWDFSMCGINVVEVDQYILDMPIVR